ncbi:MAG: GDSL-type esterase/lipase family protein [Pseudomonadota bacterium]
MSRTARIGRVAVPLAVGGLGLFLALRGGPGTSTLGLVLWAAGALAVTLGLATALPSGRARAAAVFVAAVFLISEGLDLATVPSRWASSLGLVLLAAGGVAGYWVLFASEAVAGRLPKAWRIAGAVLAVVVVALFATMLVAANYRLGPTPAFQATVVTDGAGRVSKAWDPLLGWGPFAEDAVGERLHVIDPKTRHLLVLGDSVVYGTGVEDEETFVRLLAQRLDGVQVLNAGIPGWSIDQYRIYQERLLPRLEPALVLVGVYAGNDYEVTGLEWNWGASKSLFDVAEDGTLRDAARSRGCVDGLSRSLLFRLVWARKQLAKDAIEFFCKPHSLTWEETDRSVTVQLKAIRDAAEAAGAPVLFLLLPDHGQLRRAGSPRMIYANRYRDLLRIFLDEGLPFVDLAPRFALLSEEEEEAAYRDPAHYSPEGHRRVAAWILAELATRDLQPVRSPPRRRSPPG